MKRKIAIVMAAMMLLMCMGCSFMDFSAFQTQPVFKPIPSEIYKTNVAPLINVLNLVYGSELDPKYQEALNLIIADLHTQSMTKESVNVFPALIAVATPIALSDIKSDVELTKEEATLALVGLETLKQFYHPEAESNGSPLLESLYPILKEMLLQKAVQ